MAFALPIYKNYTDENIFTQKVKIGYYKDYYKISSDNADYNLINVHNRGINFNFYLNPMYGLSYLRNIDIGMDFNLGLNKIIAKSTMSLAVIYNIPFKINLPNWRINLNLFLGGSYGIVYTKIAEYYPYYNKISNFGDTKAIKFGLEVAPKQLIDYGIMFYGEYNMIHSNYHSNIEYNFKRDKQYRSNSFTIGIIYNINYLIN